jgi:hypothetical protein
MAKVVCTVTYHKRAKKVTRTYHIEFEKSDRLEINAATKDLALKVEEGNPAAKKLVKRWKTQRSPKAIQLQEGVPSDVYIVEPEKEVAAPSKPMTKFTASFVMPTAELAKFICGYYEADPEPGEEEFTPYDGGLGQSFPRIP